MSYLFLKYAHIVSATLLFGTGLGTAFHGWLAFRTRDAVTIAAVGRSVVLADWLFTAPTVVVQPATGVALAMRGGFALTSGWLLLALALYILVGLCWLPVVWLQIRLQAMAQACMATGAPLASRYITYARLWFALGFPAFAAVLAIFYLMIFKPEIGW